MTLPLRVLLIDDNPSDRTLVLRELYREFNPVQVSEVIDAQEFQAAIDAGAFDVVVTDYQLYWSNGLEVLRAVKQRYPRCPVIMVTNTGSEEIAVEALKSGLDDYILKAPGRYVRVPVAVRVALERAENQRRAALTELRLQFLLNRLRVGVFRANAQGELLESNAAFFSLLGAESLAAAQPQLQPYLQESYQQLIDLPAGQQQDRELQLTRPNGTAIWALLSLTLSQLDTAFVIEGLLEDITDCKQAELAVQQLNQALETRVQVRTAELETTNQKLTATNRDLEEFAYSVSHDLRTPLRVIQGLSEILLSSEAADLSATALDYVRRIARNAQEGQVLIENLLTYSRLNRVEIALQPIDLSNLLGSILQQLEPDIQSKRAQIQVIPPLPIVQSNRLILSQIITNLLTNALKFVEPGVPPQIRIWAQPQEAEERSPDRSSSSPGATAAADAVPETGTLSPPQIRLWIEDNGIGIARADQQRIFNVFTRIYSSAEYPGTGIGLAIVRRGIERLGGKIGLESQPGQGSRFWVELPLSSGESSIAADSAAG